MLRLSIHVVCGEGGLVKIYLNIPEWDNRWIPYVYASLTGHSIVDNEQEADVLLSMWMDPTVINWSHKYPDKLIITYCRRFELWQREWLHQMNWSAINSVIFVSKYYKKLFSRIFPDLTSIRKFIVPNGVDLQEWKLKSVPSKTKKIALVASTRWVKNFALAFQILLELPKDYTLHLIGMGGGYEFTGIISEYYQGLGLEDRFFSHPQVKATNVQDWLKDKEFILSCSYSEGNPNNVIEAMAMGIKPIVHLWPGARDQFPVNSLFRTVKEAVGKITDGNYTPHIYRDWACGKYSARNFDKIPQIIEACAC